MGLAAVASRQALSQLLELRGSAVEQPRWEVWARADECSEDVAGREHVQALAREVLQPQVAIRVARCALEPRRQRLGVTRERAHEIERRVEAYGTQRRCHGRVARAARDAVEGA